MDTRNGIRHSHTAWGAELIGGGWPVVGVGGVQADSAPHQKRR